MFEDIVKERFEGIDTGDRDIASEVKESIKSIINFAQNESDNAPKESREALEIFIDRHLDELAQMYIDNFEPKELIKLMEFQVSETAKKQLRSQMEIQKFMIEKLMDIFCEIDDRDITEADMEAEEIYKDDEKFIWDTE